MLKTVCFGRVSKIYWAVHCAALFLLLPPVHFLSGMEPNFEKTQVPREYGAVIYRYNAESPNQLFIIGTSHRDSLTRMNGPNTPKVQAEVYKIGEWLIRNRDLKLLLPEGFFKMRPEDGGAETKTVSQAITDKEPKNLDLTLLEKKLSDNRIFVNAEILLKENYLLYLEQIEDKTFYNAVSKGIQKLAESRNNPREYLFAKSELDYLQDRRTAALLQKIPEIVANEYTQGKITGKTALFTIGMNHIQSIIKYMEDNKITVFCPPSTSVPHENYVADVNLIKENFGICIILPRTLLDDRETVKVNGLEKIVNN
jgi:hypothetical protein